MGVKPPKKIEWRARYETRPTSVTNYPAVMVHLEIPDAGDGCLGHVVLHGPDAVEGAEALCDQINGFAKPRWADEVTVAGWPPKKTG